MERTYQQWQLRGSQHNPAPRAGVQILFSVNVNQDSLARWLTPGLVGKTRCLNSVWSPKVRKRSKNRAGVQPLCKQLDVPWKTKNRTATGLRGPTGMYPKELKAGPQRGVCTPVLMAAWLPIAKWWEQPKCRPVNEWIKKMWCLSLQ